VLTKLREHDTGRRSVSAEEWETRVDLAALYRLAHHFGWTDLIYTHISARIPGTEHYLLNPFGLTFDEVTASNLLKVDLDGNIIDPSEHPIHTAAFVIHSAVHAARPDAGCVVHNHTRAGMALSTFKDGLLPITQHALAFHGQIAYHASEGFAVDLAERERLASDLGSKRVMILHNHGVLVVGTTVAHAFAMTHQLEKAMQAQLDALATGRELIIVSEETAERAADYGFGRDPRPGNYGEPLGWYEWPAMLRLAERLDPAFRQ